MDSTGQVYMESTLKPFENSSRHHKYWNSNFDLQWLNKNINILISEKCQNFMRNQYVQIVKGTKYMVWSQKKIPKTSSLQTCLLVLDWPLFVPICTETLDLPAQNPWYYPTTLVFYTFYLKMHSSCFSSGWQFSWLTL